MPFSLPVVFAAIAVEKSEVPNVSEFSSSRVESLIFVVWTSMPLLEEMTERFSYLMARERMMTILFLCYCTLEPSTPTDSLSSENTDQPRWSIEEKLCQRDGLALPLD